MECIVAGIASTSDPAELEKITSDCSHLDPARIAVVTKSSKTQAHDESALNFVHPSERTLSTGSGGTGVPGIGGSTKSLSSFVARDTHVPQYLHQLAIPNEVAENYNLAVDAGRSVVTYKAQSPDDAAAVEPMFRACGLVNVRTLHVRSAAKSSP